MGLHQRRAGLLLDGGDVLRGLVAGHLKQQLAGQRVAVGVQAGGGHADEHVAGLDARAGDHLVAIDRAHDEAGQVVLAVGIEAGHLRGFAADERAAVGLAGLGQAGDHALGHFGVELAAGQVIQKEQRRGALHGDVVDAVVHQVRAHGVVQAQLEGDLQLGAHAVGRADQDGVFPALQVEPEERAKAADAAQHIAVKGLLRQVLDAVLGAVATADVHAGIGVGYGFGFGFVGHGADFLRMESRSGVCWPERSILAGFRGSGGEAPNRGCVQNLRKFANEWNRRDGVCDSDGLMYARRLLTILDPR